MADFQNLGDAVLRLFVDDAHFQQQMDNASNSVGSKLAQASTTAGIAMTAAGATITAALTGAVASAVSYGSSIVDAAAKSQVSAQAFSELQHAAEASGSSGEKLQLAFLNIVKSLDAAKVGTNDQATAFNALGISSEQLAASSPSTIFELIGPAAEAAANGSEKNIEAFKALGLGINDLQSMSPEQIFSLLNEQMQISETGSGKQAEAFARLGLSVDELRTKTPDEIFMLLAGKIAQVQDPLEQSTLAMDVFGAKCGLDLLPLINEGTAGIQALREEAQRLGIAVSDEQAGQLEAFGDAWENISKSMQGVAIQVGTALMPVLTELVNNSIIPTIESVTAWIRANPELTQTIIQMVAAAGAIMTVLGPILVMLPGLAIAFEAVSAAMAVMGITSTIAFGPIGIAVTLAIASGYLLWENWDSISQGLSAVWTWLAETASWAWGGIVDSINWAMEQVESAWNWLTNAVANIGNIVATPFQAISDWWNGNDAEVPQFASGGTMPHSGLAIVGERGPELVNLPAGARVFNNANTQSMLGNTSNTYAPSISVTVNNANNLTADDVAKRIAIELDKSFRR